MSLAIGSVWARLALGLVRFGRNGFWREYHNWLGLGAVWVRFGRTVFGMSVTMARHVNGGLPRSRQELGGGELHCRARS